MRKIILAAGLLGLAAMTAPAHALETPGLAVCDGGSGGGAGYCTAMVVGTAGTLSMHSVGAGWAEVDCYSDPNYITYVGGAYLERSTTGSAVSHYDRLTPVAYCEAYGYHATFTAS
jgi:hypothetical protein